MQKEDISGVESKVGRSLKGVMGSGQRIVQFG